MQITYNNNTSSNEKSYKKESIDNEEREHAYKLQGNVQFQMQKGTEESREQHGYMANIVQHRKSMLLEENHSFSNCSALFKQNNKILYVFE